MASHLRELLLSRQEAVSFSDCVHDMSGRICGPDMAGRGYMYLGTCICTQIVLGCYLWCVGLSCGVCVSVRTSKCCHWVC